MGDAKAASTPFEAGSFMWMAEAREKGGQPGSQDMAEMPYRFMVGSLMYLVVCTRPDMSMAVSALSRYCENLHPKHWKARKRVLRYLKWSAREGLSYSLGEDVAV